MTLFSITVANVEEPYFVDAPSPEEAIDEVKILLGIEELSGDISEVVQ